MNCNTTHYRANSSSVPGDPTRFVPQTAAVAYAGLFLTVIGVAFAIWARLQIGRNWSARVTIKTDHKLVRTGPYAIVRHPIYSGFLLALLGTAIENAEIRGFLAFLVALIGMKVKSQMEEQFMKEQFGAEYTEYQHHVKSLIPFIW